jgi:16S rRNA C967 or C1407 C5-methylase (RsmB/RsmF family)
LVYSTCSIAVLENEAVYYFKKVVDYALRNRFVKVVPPEIDMGEPGSI